MARRGIGGDDAEWVNALLAEHMQRIKKGQYISPLRDVEKDLTVNNLLRRAEEQDRLMMQGLPYDENFGLLDELDKLGVYMSGGALDFQGLSPNTIRLLEDRLE